MKNLVYFLVVTIVALGSQTSWAGQYDIYAAGCVPDPASVAAGVYATANGYVTFASGTTGEITLHCAITDASALASAEGMEVSFTYTDTEGNSSNQVAWNLYSISKTTGALTFLTGQDSHTACTSGSGVRSCPISNSLDLNPGPYWYFFDIYLKRNSTMWTETFYGITAEAL